MSLRKFGFTQKLDKQRSAAPATTTAAPATTTPAAATTTSATPTATATAISAAARVKFVRTIWNKMKVKNLANKCFVLNVSFSYLTPVSKVKICRSSVEELLRSPFLQTPGKINDDYRILVNLIMSVHNSIAFILVGIKLGLIIPF